MFPWTPIQANNFLVLKMHSIDGVGFTHFRLPPKKPGESVKLFSKLDDLATQNRSCNVFQRWVKSCWLMNLAALNGSWTMYQRSLTSCWPIMESAWPVKPLPHSWSDLGLFIRGTCILIGFFFFFFFIMLIKFLTRIFYFRRSRKSR